MGHRVGNIVRRSDRYFVSISRPVSRRNTTGRALRLLHALVRRLSMISEHLLSRYSGDSPSRVAVREFVERVCRRYIDLGLADLNFEGDLCCGSDARFWQRLSEALLAHELLEVGLIVRPSREGPDMLIQHEGRNIWIEI